MSAESLGPYELDEEILGDAFPALTGRECEVLRWLIHGKKDPEIAVLLGICTLTASTHVRNLLAKLCVENRQAASMEAVNVVICHRPPVAKPMPRIRTRYFERM